MVLLEVLPCWLSDPLSVSLLALIYSLSSGLKKRDFGWRRRLENCNVLVYDLILLDLTEAGETRGVDSLGRKSLVSWRIVEDPLAGIRGGRWEVAEIPIREFK